MGEAAAGSLPLPCLALVVAQLPLADVLAVRAGGLLAVIFVGIWLDASTACRRIVLAAAAV